MREFFYGLKFSGASLCIVLVGWFMTFKGQPWSGGMVRWQGFGAVMAVPIVLGLFILIVNRDLHRCKRCLSWLIKRRISKGVYLGTNCMMCDYHGDVQVSFEEEEKKEEPEFKHQPLRLVK